MNDVKKQFTNILRVKLWRKIIELNSEKVVVTKQPLM